MIIDTNNEQKKFLDYKPHPLAELLPEMGEDELWQLAKNIAESHDLLEPITLFEGKILDGRNRYKACKLIFRPFTEKDFVEFDESCDPFDFVDGKNFHRRHLTTWQRAKYGCLNYLDKEREKAKERQEKTQLDGRTENGEYKVKQGSVPYELEGTEKEGEALDLAAKKARVSRQILWQVEKIIITAETDPEIKAKVEKLDKKEKNVSITGVFNDIRTKEREQELLETAKKPRKISGTIIHGDFFEKIKKIKDNSIDLLFVDPPYNVLKEDWDTFESLKAYRVFCQEWLSLVMPKVKDTGRVYICSSQKHKYKFYTILQTNLFFGFNFGQEIIWHYKNNMRISNDNEYHYVYDPIFYLYGKNAVKLNFPHEAFKDGIMTNVWTIAIPQNNFSEGKFHRTQKPLELLRRIILTGSQEDDLILDPFAGSGTTGVICEELGRKYILIEKDPKQIEISKGRIKGRLCE